MGGDDACLLRCAGQSPSEEINKLLGCWNSKCKTAFEPLPAKAHLRITNEECETEATCVEVYNCVHEQCDMESCHADPDCEGIEECAFSCACGDDACLLRCAGQSPSEEINKLLGCWNSKCKTAFKPLPTKTHLGITNEECESEATCVEVCNCVHEQCLNQSQCDNVPSDFRSPRILSLVWRGSGFSFFFGDNCFVVFFSSVLELALPE